MSRAVGARMTHDVKPPIDDPETYAIFGAAIAVHRHMGRGFLEPVYRPCVAIEFQRRKIPFQQEVALPVSYDGIPLPVSFRADFVCFNAIIVEVKALPTLGPREQAQLMNYLKAAGMHRGVLLNFGSDVLGKKRVVWNLPRELDPLNRGMDLAPKGGAWSP
jgi:GxxExxY protein